MYEYRITIYASTLSIVKHAYCVTRFNTPAWDAANALFVEKAAALEGAGLGP